jgi:DivIVA domain-containing protein
MATDPPDAEQIRQLTFPRSWAWRGYDAAEVDKFLDRLAGWLERDGGNGPQRESAEMESELISTFETTIEDLERQVANGRRRERRLSSKLEEAQRQLQAARAAGPEASRAPARTQASAAQRRRKRSPQRLDLNEATFVDLRSMGLGVAGSARLIAMRDIRGRFDSLEVLDELEGYPDSTIEKLKKRLYVSPAE